MFNYFIGNNKVIYAVFCFFWNNCTEEMNPGLPVYSNKYFSIGNPDGVGLYIAHIPCQAFAG